MVFLRAISPRWLAALRFTLRRYGPEKNQPAGYRIYKFTSGSLNTSGLPYTGDLDFEVTFDAAGYEDGGWNLISNPYYSTIDWDDADWTKTNIDNATYVYDPATKNYASYVNGTGSNGGDQYIAKGQAFYVHTNNSNPSLIITESVKSTESKSLQRPEATQEMSIILTNQATETQDELVIKIDVNSTTNFDSEYDALKWLGENHNISVIGTDGKPLSISSIPLAAGSLPLKTDIYTNGTYTFSFNNVEEFEENVYLIDELLEEAILLDNQTVYSYERSGEDENRFRLQYRPSTVTSIDELINFSPAIYPNPAQEELTIDLETSLDAIIKITALNGEVVYSEVTSGKSIVNVSLSDDLKGLYTVQIISGGNTSIQKIVKL